MRLAIRTFFDRALRAFAAITITFSSILLNVWVQHVAAASCPGVPPACVHMLLFWDGVGAVPSGWTDISATYNNMFPRGDTVANFGTTGGTTNHIPTVASVTTSINTSQASNSGSATHDLAGTGHTHPPASVTVTDGSPASNNNLPVYRTLRLMEYTGGPGGIPNVIPVGGIAIFDDSPGIPTDGTWTRLSAQDGEMIRIGTTAGSTGGSDTHNYTLTWSGLGSSSTSDAVGHGSFLGGTTASWGAAPGHTHAAPAPTTSTTLSSLPPYVTPLLAKANVNTPTISVGFSAMFDGDPGGGWVIRSDSTGGADNTIFYHQFLRPNTIWNGTSQGQASESLPQASAVTGPAIGTVDNLALALGTGAPATHTHTLTATFNQSTDLVPPYFGVVIAEKVNFILSDYRWYEDSGANDVTDPWSVLDVAPNTAIPSTPPAYEQPDITNQLRLRLLVKVNGNNLAANVAQFKIQYRQGATDGSCTNGTWTDVDTAAIGTGAWRYGTSAVPGHPSDGDTLTTTKLSADVKEQFIDSSSSSKNPNVVSIGQTMEYDFYLQDNAALGATHYYFRVLESNGTLLSEYDVCPGLATYPQTAQEMRHGLFFIDGLEGSFQWAD